MSEPKRYKPFLNQQGGRYIPSMDCPDMKEDKNGEWVSLADYARLKAEVRYLESEVERLRNNNEYIDKKLDEYIDGKEEEA
jgi:hypothetical protein